MTTLRQDLLAVADELRQLPVDFGVRPTTVTLVRRTWWGGRRGAAGGYTDIEQDIAPTPGVKVVSTREVAGSGGRYEMGDVKAFDITPAYPGPPPGGYAPADLKPAATANGEEWWYRLAGEINGEYQVVHVDQTQDEVSFSMVLRRRASTP